MTGKVIRDAEGEYFWFWDQYAPDDLLVSYFAEYDEYCDKKGDEIQTFEAWMAEKHPNVIFEKINVYCI